MLDVQLHCLVLAGLIVVVRQLSWTLSSSASDEGKSTSILPLVNLSFPQFL